MRVRMRRRYRKGAQPTKREFADEPWACGMLTLEHIEGRERLGLWVSGPTRTSHLWASYGGQNSPLARTTPSALPTLKRSEIAGSIRCGTAKLAVLHGSKSAW